MDSKVYQFGFKRNQKKVFEGYYNMTIPLGKAKGNTAYKQQDDYEILLYYARKFPTKIFENLFQKHRALICRRKGTIIAGQQSLLFYTKQNLVLFSLL